MNYEICYTYKIMSFSDDKTAEGIFMEFKYKEMLGS